MCKLQWDPWVHCGATVGPQHFFRFWALTYCMIPTVWCIFQGSSDVLWSAMEKLVRRWALGVPDTGTLYAHVWYLCQGTMSFRPMLAACLITVWCMFQGMGDGRHAWGSLWVRCGATAGPRHSRLLPRPTTSMVRPKEWRSKTSGPCPWSFAHLRIYLLELLFLTNWSQKPKDGAGKL